MKKISIFLTIFTLHPSLLMAFEDNNSREEHSLTLYFDKDFQSSLSRGASTQPLYVGFIVQDPQGSLTIEESYGYDRQAHQSKYHFYKPKTARFVIVSSFPLGMKDDIAFALKSTPSGKEITHKGPVLANQKLALLAGFAEKDYEKKQLASEMLTIHEIEYHHNQALQAHISIESSHGGEGYFVIREFTE